MAGDWFARRETYAPPRANQTALDKRAARLSSAPWRGAAAVFGGFRRICRDIREIESDYSGNECSKPDHLHARCLRDDLVNKRAPIVVLDDFYRRGPGEHVGCCMEHRKDQILQFFVLL